MLLEKLMAKSFKTPSSKLTDIAVNHFAIQHTREEVSHSSKPVDAICHNKHQAAHTSHNSNGHTLPAPARDCPNCTQQHPAGRSNCPTTKVAPTYIELFIDVINYGTIGDIHPEEIVIDVVCAPWCNEAYTMVELPASASSRGTASLCIEVDTGAGSNVLPHHVF